MLTWLILIPIMSALVVLLLPRQRTELYLPVGIGLSTLPAALTGVIFFSGFTTGEAGFQLTEQLVWWERMGISYRVGIDGISLVLVALTVLLVPISLAASFSITHRLKEFVIYILLLEAGLIGVFVSLDMFTFFVFFEVILIPMYFIIGIWGSDRRIYAAVKFFLYTAVGSALLLAAIISLAVLHARQTGEWSFAYLDWLDLEIARSTQWWLFGAFGLAFAIKVPLFPFHTWLPDAHVEAPTAGSVLLAGVLLKLGTYGLLRFNLTLFPQASVDLAWLLVVLGVIGVIYGAVVAIVQNDLKKLVAYSSVSHLGFIVLGIFAFTSAGLAGGVLQMVNHGLTTGALFLLVGILYEQRHTKQIDQFGGLAAVTPVTAGVFLLMAFASIGLPGLNGFVGEFLILIGSYPTQPVGAVIAAVGVILAAIYLLWAYQRVFTGPITQPSNRELSDLSPLQLGVFAPLIAAVILLGLYPQILLERLTPSTELILDRIEATTDFDPPPITRLTEVWVGEDDN